MSDVQWFYEQNGERKGPVNRDQLEELLSGQRLNLRSSVWREGFADWTPISNTELAPAAGVTPPPLNSSKISDAIVWLIALSPAIGLLLAFIVGENSPIWTVVIFFILTCLDLGAMRKAGYNRPAMFWALLPMAYLFLRSRVLGKSQAPFIVWILLQVIVLAAVNALTRYN